MKTTHLYISHSGLPTLKIGHISDLHNAKIRGLDEEILKNSNVNFFCITGDLIDRRRPGQKNAKHLIDTVSGIAPAYFAVGNHEMGSPWQYEEMQSYFEDKGIVDVTEKTAETSLGLSIGGVRVYRDFEKYQRDVFERHPEIMLCHRPEHLKRYAEYGIPLILAGHAHGGQWRLPLTDGLFAPGQGLLPKMTSGVRCEENTTMVISRGLGNSSFPLRLFNRPEFLIIHINEDREDE